MEARNIQRTLDGKVFSKSKFCIHVRRQCLSIHHKESRQTPCGTGRGIYSVPPDLIIQGRDRHLKQPRGLGLMAAGLFQSSDDHLNFKSFHRFTKAQDPFGINLVPGRTGRLVGQIFILLDVYLEPLDCHI